MQLLSLIGILLAMAFIVYAVVKGYSLVWVSIVAALIVAVTGRMDLVESMGTTYMEGLAGFVVTLFPLFLGGQMLGKLLEYSGLSKSIARSVVKVLGAKNIVLAAFIAVYLMTAVGISVYIVIFTVYPMCLAFFKQTNISRSLIPAIVLGGAASAQMLPGIPIAANIIPADYLGTTAMAAPITAIVGAVIVTGLNLWYLIWQGNKSMASGKPFELLPGEEADGDLSTDQLPNPWLALAPFAVIIVLLNVLGWPAWGALIAGALVMLLMFWKKYPDKKKIFNDVAKGSMSVIGTAAIVGFGSVVSAAPGYSYISSFLTSTSFGNPYIYAAIAVSVIAAVTGSATGSMRLILDSSAARMLSMGARPEALSRVVTMASFGCDSLPHSSAVVLTLQCCNVSHKEGYWHLFVTTVLTNTLALIVGVIMASLGIS